MYQVHWGAKELEDLGLLVTSRATKAAVRKVLVDRAKKGSKAFGSLPGLRVIFMASDLATNPWTVAKTRAAMTGAVLADLIARTNEGPFVLLGHSLGARVMVSAATRDRVLRLLYTLAERGERAVGLAGFNTKFRSVKDRDVTRLVGSHSDYIRAVKLQR